MKGLILKDIYVLSKTCRSIFLICIVFIAVYIFGGEDTFFLFYPCIFAGMLPMTLISYDEKDNWDKYACSLPLTRAQMVSSKYIIGLALTIIVLTCIAAVQVVNVVKGTMDLDEVWISTALMGSVCIIIPAFLYPWVFKLGAEKGRIFYYFSIGVACAALLAVSNAKFVNEGWLMGSPAIFFIIFAAAILIYAVSWFLSIKFYKAREL